MFYTKRIAVFFGLCIGMVALTAGVAHAKDFGPPLDKPHVSCTAIWIDPPEGAWVHLVGDIEGQDAEGNAVEFHADEYGIAYGINTFFPKTFNELDKMFGNVEYELAATWSLGKGYSQASGGYITCHEAHDNRCDDNHPNEGSDDQGHHNPDCDTTTTVPVTAPEQPVTPTTKVLGSSITTYCTTEACLLPPASDKGARGVPVAQELPRTGSTTLPLGLIGLAALPIGLALARVKRVAR